MIGSLFSLNVMKIEIIENEAHIILRSSISLYISFPLLCMRKDVPPIARRAAPTRRAVRYVS